MRAAGLLTRDEARRIVQHRQAAGAAETTLSPRAGGAFQTVRCAPSLLGTRCLRYCSMTHRIAGRVRQRSISAARALGGVILRDNWSGLAKPASRLATVRSARLKRSPAR